MSKVEADPWVIRIRGNWGVLVVSAWTGLIIEVEPAEGEEDDVDGDWGYPGIARFDIDEYRETYGVVEDTDILDIGYWTHSGLYEPAEPDFRKNVRTECQPVSQR